MQKGLKIWLLIGVVVAGLVGTYAYCQPSKESDVVKPGTPQQVEPVKEPPQEESKKEPKKAEKDVYEVGDINSSMMGKTVTVRCQVSNVKKPKDTTFFKIKDVADNKSINGVLFNKTNKDNEGRKELLEQSSANGSIIYIEGEVSEYKNTLQIKAWRIYTK